MALTKLKDHRGDVIFVDPSVVLALGRSAVDGCTTVCIPDGPIITAMGKPDEVHALLFGPTDTLSKAKVVEAFTHEYRMALETEEMDVTRRLAHHHIRFVLHALAKALGVTLDPEMINTPLPEEAS